MTNNQYRLLMVHLVRLPELRKAAIGNPHRDDLFPESLQDLREIWDTLIGFSTTAGKPDAEPTLSIVLSDLEEESSIKEAKLIWKLAQEDVTLDTGQVLLREAGFDALKRRLAIGISTAESREEFTKLVDESKSSLDADLPSSDGDVVNFLDIENIERYTENLHYQPTYIDFFDYVTDGGLVPGEIWVMLGPMGGGKTMLSTQISSSLALNQTHVLYMTYEQALSGDVVTRNVTQLLGIDGTRIRNKKFNEWPEDIIASYRENIPKFSPYLHAADMSGKNSGAGRGSDAIVEKIEAIEKKCGERPRIIILDWLLPLLTQVVQVKAPGSALESDKLRIYAQELMHDLERIAHTKSTSILLMHQLNADLARAGVGKRPKATDGQEIRTLANLANGCLLLTNRDPKTNVCRLMSDKNRRGPLMETFLYMNGTRCKFESAEDVEISRSGQIVDKKEGGFNDEASW